MWSSHILCECSINMMSFSWNWSEFQMVSIKAKQSHRTILPYFWACYNGINNPSKIQSNLKEIRYCFLVYVFLFIKHFKTKFSSNFWTDTMTWEHMKTLPYLSMEMNLYLINLLIDQEFKNKSHVVSNQK